MIPKIIHYCWFGRNPLPDFAIKCIESWRKYLPDHEIKEWNEDNFDVNSITYTQQAYKRKMYAFVSDYARFWILYHYGGVYFDVDVELIRPLTPILKKGPYMGLESNNTINVGIYNGNNLGVACNPGLGMAAEPNMSFCKELLDGYQTLKFIYPSGATNTKTVVSYTSEMLIKHGYNRTINDIQQCGGFTIYPQQYFCPHINKKNNEIDIKPETYSIHHYAATWVNSGMKFKGFISQILEKLLPSFALKKVRSIYRFLLRKK